MSLLHLWPRIAVVVIVAATSLSGCVSLQDQSELAFTLSEEPQFSNEMQWASLPWRVDPSDEIPKKLPDSPPYDSLEVDVFFCAPHSVLQWSILQCCD